MDNTPRTAQRTRTALRGCPQGFGQPANAIEVQPPRGLPTFPQALLLVTRSNKPTQPNSQAIRHAGLSPLRQWHDWTIEEYREAFHLLQRTSTAAHGFSEQREQLKQRVDAGELVPLGPDRPPTPRERVAGPQRMPHWRSLAARRPDLAAQLHPARNGELSAQHIAMHSTTSLWWQCGAARSFVRKTGVGTRDHAGRDHVQLRLSASVGLGQIDRDTWR